MIFFHFSYDFRNKFNKDFEATKRDGNSPIGNDKDNVCYGKLIYVEEKDKYPVFTFTAKWGDETIDCSEPGRNYLKTIIDGIKENFNLTDNEILDYLIIKCGIQG